MCLASCCEPAGEDPAPQQGSRVLDVLRLPLQVVSAAVFAGLAPADVREQALVSLDTSWDLHCPPCCWEPGGRAPAAQLNCKKPGADPFTGPSVCERHGDHIGKHMMSSLTTTVGARVLSRPPQPAGTACWDLAGQRWLL